MNPRVVAGGPFSALTASVPALDEEWYAGRDACTHTQKRERERLPDVRGPATLCADKGAQRIFGRAMDTDRRAASRGVCPAGIRQILRSQGLDRGHGLRLQRRMEGPCGGGPISACGPLRCCPPPVGLGCRALKGARPRLCAQHATRQDTFCGTARMEKVTHRGPPCCSTRAAHPSTISPRSRA